MTDNKRENIIMSKKDAAAVAAVMGQLAPIADENARFYENERRKEPAAAELLLTNQAIAMASAIAEAVAFKALPYKAAGFTAALVMKRFADQIVIYRFEDTEGDNA